MAQPKEVDSKLYSRDILRFTLLMILGVIINYWSYQVPDGQILVTPLYPKTSELKQKESGLIQQNKSTQDTVISTEQESDDPVSPKHNPFPFDPNSTTETELKKLGFSSYACNNWLAYLKAGGRFKSADDMFKIYGVDTALVRQIIPFAKWPKPSPTESFSESSTIIYVNRASAADWQKLKGIGPVLSKRIVKFRDALGGFHNVAQVGQTFGLPDSTFQMVKSHLKLVKPFNKIFINSISEDELKRHPYFSWKQAQILVKYRDERSQLKDVRDLWSAEIFDSSEIQRLRPYLDFATPKEEEKDTVVQTVDDILHSD